MNRDPAPGAPASLRAAVETALAGAGAPGCSMVLVEASAPLWAGAFGLADLRRERPATPETVYPLFSGTKLFTAAAILQLAERGLLALEDPVDRWVPEASAARGVTLLHLLSHRSGLRDTLRGFLAVTFPPAEPPTSTEALGRFRIAPARAPGQRVEYRNVNYALLGEVVTRVSALEYREYVRRHLLEPLGMDAGFGYTAGMRDRAATGYLGRRDPMRLVLRWVLPGTSARLYGERVGAVVGLNEYRLDTAAIGGLVGSMPAFAEFLRAQLGGGGGVLGPDWTRRMQTRVAEGAAGIESRAGVGLGWKIGRVDGRTFLNHEGGGAGFTSELRLYPEQGVGIALAMNQMRMPRTMRAAHRICEAVLAARGELRAAHAAGC